MSGHACVIQKKGDVWQINTCNERAVTVQHTPGCQEHVRLGRTTLAYFQAELSFFYLKNKSKKAFRQTKQKQSTELKPHNTNHTKSLTCKVLF